MKKQVKNFDVIIIGAGPVGLAFACSLAQLNLKIGIFEKGTEKNLAEPLYDGRETAHTYASIDLLKKIGIFNYIPAQNVSPIQEAKVLDGSSPSYFLNFKSSGSETSALGFIISNNVVRRAAYLAACDYKNITIIPKADFKSIQVSENLAVLELMDGRVFQAALIAAADGRFSSSRRQMGIATATRDFGRTIIVSRLKHHEPHHNIAYECFNYERTLAILPLSGNTVSAVITLPNADVPAVMGMSPTAFARDIQNRFEGRLGVMTSDSERYTYPLMGVFAKSFVAPRYALIGDACVGMHPVTAHGFNFGLKGLHTLACEIEKALNLGMDIGSLDVLIKYNSKHRAATLPLYLTTNALVGLYTDERRPAKFLRRIGLRVANTLAPINSVVTNYLADPIKVQKAGFLVRR